jgi:hypothetical protein
MKYIVYNAKTGRRELSPAEVRDLLTPDQQLEAIEAKRQDPLEEVSFMTSGGVIVCEM